MARIQSGAYTPLYSPDTSKVQVQAFFLDRYPVTNGQFLQFVKTHPRWNRGQVKRLFAEQGYLKHWAGDTITGTASAPNTQSPVTNVSWFAAKDYCECQGKRLPTVAEWEYVALASRTKQDASHDTAFIHQIMETYNHASTATLPRVGSTFRNYYGVYDLHGLIWEWTQDFNSALSTGESRGDVSLDKNLFCGGGAVNSKNLANYPAYLRFAMRVSLKANYTVWNLGFRCARDIPATTTKP